MTEVLVSHYTPNFSRRELACKCGCRIPTGVDRNLAKLAQALEELRALAKSPLIITSGYRCFAHNQRVGGAKGSQHVFGVAADIVSKRLTPKELAALANQVPAFINGGIGVYSSWIHVDVREGRARW
jgi:zinc D-Ala-D-Ala carboxypeptidase